MRRTLPVLLPALLTALAASGCLTRSIRETVYESGGVEVRLRSQKQGRQVLAKGYDHPKTIAPVRLAHILAAVDVRLDPDESPQRLPAISLDTLFTVADGLSQSLAEADPNQDVVVFVTEREKRLGIFDHEFVTSFLAYVKSDVLYLHFDRYRFELGKSRSDQKLREPQIGDPVMDFRIVPSRGMNLVDAQSVAVFWRDEIFSKPTRTQVMPGGRVVRREILMESPSEEAPDAADATAPGPPPEPLPPNLSPDALRALADLEEARREGTITELDYQVRRNEILGGP